MIFLDINTFFSPKAGGIRTYHQAKIEWFRKHPGAGYWLVYPGAARLERKEAENVTLVEGFGPALTSDPAGYRLLIDFFRLFTLIRRLRPDVIEAGDPWLTGIFCLILRKLGLYKGLLVSFYHSDPVPSYFQPWAQRGSMQSLKRPLIAAAGAVFYWLQRGYDLTAVSSKTMEDRLRAKGVRALAHLPFGVPAFFLSDIPHRTEASSLQPPAADGTGAGADWVREAAQDTGWANGQVDESAPGAADKNAREIRLLYAGRLDPEKGIDLILEVLPGLLKRANVSVTVIGRGKRAQSFVAYKHDRYRYLGFIEDPMRMRENYDSHHILMAPGPFETFGLGVLEAMARGMIVVGPDQGGTAELLRQAKSPFIFETGNPAEFHRTVARAMRSDWSVEMPRSLFLAREYGTWDDSIGRMITRYTARLGARAL
ncbi:MAG: glycosyltransferase [Fibrobacteria bacterium]